MVVVAPGASDWAKLLTNGAPSMVLIELLFGMGVHVVVVAAVVVTALPSDNDDDGGWDETVAAVEEAREATAGGVQFGKEEPSTPPDTAEGLEGRTFLVGTE